MLQGPGKCWVPLPPHYFEYSGLRLHYLDEAPANAAADRIGSDRQQPETLLLLHGNPTWSFLYRHVIPHLTAAGFRVLALDFAGFGRSDKPLEESDMTSELHASSVVALLDHLDVTNATLVMHDCHLHDVVPAVAAHWPHRAPRGAQLVIATPPAADRARGRKCAAGGDLDGWSGHCGAVDARQWCHEDDGALAAAARAAGLCCALPHPQAQGSSGACTAIGCAGSADSTTAGIRSQLGRSQVAGARYARIYCLALCSRCLRGRSSTPLHCPTAHGQSYWRAQDTT